MRRRLVQIALAVVGAFLLLQLVPYGWWHENPAVLQDAPWPDSESAALARAACYDCHSNETDWPAYSYVAPLSWLVRRDVENGRDAFNFSTWPDDAGDADKAVEELEDGSMPPDQYQLAHPDARLSSDEVATLIDALRTLEGDDDRSGRGGGDGEG